MGGSRVPTVPNDIVLLGFAPKVLTCASFGRHSGHCNVSWDGFRRSVTISIRKLGLICGCRVADADRCGMTGKVPSSS
jgi:hypothetical protein